MESVHLYDSCDFGKLHDSEGFDDVVSGCIAVKLMIFPILQCVI
jgi:hypothetical protein